MIEDKLADLIKEALKNLNIEAKEILLEYPADLAHGDYSTNVAFQYAKEAKMKPKELAEALRLALEKELAQGEIGISKIEVAGAGFINFYLSKEFFAESLKEILEKENDFGKNQTLAGQKVMVEYTDPNPFKEFHIGHLMSNAIGESIARLIEASGAKVVRACWQGDVGLHVAKALWGLAATNNQQPTTNNREAIGKLGEAYALGSQKYESDESAKKEINELNKKIFDRTDERVNELYDWGRKVSLEHFEEIYKKLGTKFDYYFFESKEGREGEKIVAEFLKKGVFEGSNGAVVFRGEKYGLHTRVFITSQGLPTYETKELGLNRAKFEREPDISQSVIVTANEQSDYFKVVLKAMEQVMPEIAKETKHIAHGLLRFASGKMSSRLGNVITGESLIKAMEDLVMEKIKDREFSPEEKQKIAEAVGVGAIKYSILRSTIGSDIVYDFEKSISFEGDSGPYLQYTYARARSVLAKIGATSRRNLISTAPVEIRFQQEVSTAERLLYRFPEVVERAAKEFEPHHIATYLIELAGAFNNFYAKNKIIGSEEENYRLALTGAVSIILKNGLHLLGIQTPERM